MNVKRFIAVAMAATMVLGNSVTAFAVDPVGEVNGTGAVEYDDSEDIAYDSITVPSLSESTYQFEIDPDGLLADYGGENYNDGDNVFFTAIKDRAKIVVKDKDTKIYKKNYTEKDVDTGKTYWTGIVTGATGTDTITYTVADGFYLWVPKDAYSGTDASGKSGEYTAINAGNVAKYFDIVKDADDTNYDITFRKDYKAMVTSEGVVCNGKIYELGYVEVTTKDTVGSDTYDTVVDSDADPLKNYVTVNASDAITAIKDLYTDKTVEDSTVKAALETTDVDYVKATSRHIATSDVVYVTNKSTKKKTVTATITLKNANGLEVRNSSTFAADDKKASIYIAALSQASGASSATPYALAEDGDAIKGSFTVDIEGTTDTGFTYQTAETNYAGGHKYARYSNPDATYNSHSFSVTAKANDNADDDTKAAWKAYGEAFTEAGKTPTLNVVYSVTDYVAAPTTYTVTYKANDGEDTADQEETVNVGSAPTASGISFTREGYTFKGWGESSTATEADKVTLSDISAATTLYAIWVQNITDADAGLVYAEGAYWLGKTNTVGFDSLSAGDIVTVTLKANEHDAVDVTAKATVVEDGGKWIKVTNADATAAGLEDENGTYTMTALIGATRYTGTIDF